MFTTHLLRLDLPAWLTANGIDRAPGHPALLRALASSKLQRAHAT